LKWKSGNIAIFVVTVRGMLEFVQILVHVINKMHTN
jgi:hypothetical protein